LKIVCAISRTSVLIGENDVASGGQIEQLCSFSGFVLSGTFKRSIQCVVNPDQLSPNSRIG
jgi:hypothetical protein